MGINDSEYAYDLVGDAVSKLFGSKQMSKDIDSQEFMKQCIKNAPNIQAISSLERTTEDIMIDFLFDHSDTAQAILKDLQDASLPNHKA